MNLKIISHDDPQLASIKKEIADYVERAEMLGMPYWVFVVDSSPVGIIEVGKEPVQLLAPIGTPLSMIRIIDFGQPKELLQELVSKALAISKEKGVDYALTTFSAEFKELIDQFVNIGFQELANEFRMICPLNKSFKTSSTLRFERVERDKVNKFIEFTIKCMSGSPDVVLNMTLKNLRGIPEKLLDMWCNLEQLYFVYRDRKIIGILDLNSKDGVLSNIGVSPSQRGKGYGKQILLFALKTLKEGGAEQAVLKVHIDNKTAMRLYKSLGFNVAKQTITLIWRK